MNCMNNIGHFCPLKFISTKQLSIESFSELISFAGISSRASNMMLPPLQLRSNLSDDLYSSIWNQLIGKISSSLVSDIIRISMLPLIYSINKSNLFLMDFTLMWITISFFRSYLRKEIVLLLGKQSFLIWDICDHNPQMCSQNLCHYQTSYVHKICWTLTLQNYYLIYYC